MRFLAATLAALPMAAGAFAASAADLPRRAAPPPVFTPVPVFTWTGFYAGFNAGYAWSDDRVRTRAADPADVVTASDITALGIERVRFRQAGFTGGGQVGYNYQLTPGSGFVVGVEADAAYTDLSRRRSATFTDAGAFGPFAFSTRYDIESRKELGFLGTVRGRLGYAFDRFLVYGTGGFAYGDVSYRGSVTVTDTLTFGGASFTDVSATSARSSRIQTGYAYGGGIEYALPTDSFLNFFRSSAVTLKVEYLRYDLGARNVVGFFNTVPASGASTPLTISRVQTEGNIVRAGVNYKFNMF